MAEEVADRCADGGSVGLIPIHVQFQAAQQGGAAIADRAPDTSDHAALADNFSQNTLLAGFEREAGGALSAGIRAGGSASESLRVLGTGPTRFEMRRNDVERIA